MLNELNELKELKEAKTLLDLLQYRAQLQANQTLYTFLEADRSNVALSETESITYAQLAKRAQALAVQLQQYAKLGDRVLLLYPSGIEYVVAFFACLYAGMIAVPAYPPRLNRSDQRLQGIVTDSQASVVLSLQAIKANYFSEKTKKNKAKYASKELASLPWLSSDVFDEQTLLDQEKAWIHPKIDENSLVFFQYTSGSTGQPKGVMVSHRNLLCNLNDLDLGWQHDQHSIMVSWLPLFHDMGLIYGVLQPFYKGFSCYLMSPASFLQKPYRWLAAISQYRGTHTAAPNFAYDLCVERISAQQRQSLDLSSWQVALNGAEPIRQTSLQQFNQTFAECGLSEKVLSPGYGLAEATLKVSATRRDDLAFYLTVDKLALANHQLKVLQGDACQAETAQVLTGCGYTEIDSQIMIVNPQNHVACQQDQVGEIWVSGKTIPQGYWNRKAETEATFNAFTHDQQGPFMRTGDLGFVYQQHLFITGRLKDMMVIRGLNIYPQDIELTVSASHKALKNNACAVFSIEKDHIEQLVIVQEIERTALRKLDAEAVFASIRQAVAETHELQLYTIVLVRPMCVAKTSSGKIQRSACKQQFLSKSLIVIEQWQQTLLGDQHKNDTIKNKSKNKTLFDNKTAAQLKIELSHWVAQALNINVNQLDTKTPLAAYGLDSMTAVRLASVLEEWSNLSISPTLIYDYPNIEALLGYFSKHLLTNFPNSLVSDSLVSAESRQQTLSVKHTVKHTETDIAIIGMACRFPSAENISDFLILLKEGKDAISDVSVSRWDVDSSCVQALDEKQQAAVLKGGFLTEIDQFDPVFFGITPREAALMDPQQRLLLEVVWEALQHANMVPETLAGSQTGVFVGISTNDYQRLQDRQNMNIEAHSGTSNAFSIVANRLSYLLHLQGPSMAVDTACSSSLVAVHQACQSLRLGESNLAISAGVNLMLSADLSCTFAQAGMLAADGYCKSFDVNADGYVRGEGCGVVLLKRYEDAVAEGDSILACIKGSAINQDGRTNGLTAPNGLSQQAVIRSALQRADIHPSQVAYVETHGTGTPLGDPIEINALKTVLLENDAHSDVHSFDPPCYLGTVKSNMGHLEAAAGMAGLIKTVLSLQHKTIFPNLHFSQLNPLIELQGTKLKIPVQSLAWQQSEADIKANQPRIAGVSSFGFGGSNAHVVLAEAMDSMAPLLSESAIKERRDYHLFTLSANTEKGLQHLVDAYQHYLAENPETDLAKLCYTVNNARSHYKYRFAYAVQTVVELNKQLAFFSLEKDTNKPLLNDSTLKIAFLFSGQGSQYVAMGKSLLASQPVFREALLRCETILNAYLDKPLLSVIYPDSSVARDNVLDQTLYTQPALFSLEYALTQLWLSWGIKPTAVMGHSLGEYVAACIAGVFSLEDALMLVAERAKLMQAQYDKGKMVVVFAGHQQLESILQDYSASLAIAAFNAPQNTVISGDAQAIDAVVSYLHALQIKTHTLNVSHAFHSPLMQSVSEKFEGVAQSVDYHKPTLALYSNVTGKHVDETISTAAYWCQHIRQPVQFSASVQQLLFEQQPEVFLEISAKPVLLGMAQASIETADVQYLASLRRGLPDWQQLLQSLAILYRCGQKIDWQKLNQYYITDFLDIPITPFVRESYWFDQVLKPLDHYPLKHSKSKHNVANLSASSSASLGLNKTQTLRQRLSQDSLLQAKKRLHDYLQHLLAEEMGFPVEQLDKQLGFAEMGMDSMMVVNLKNRLQRDLQTPFAATLLINYANFSALFTYLYHDVLHLDTLQNQHQSNDLAEKLPFAFIETAKQDHYDVVVALSEQEVLDQIAEKFAEYC